jgi:5-formyltetrahydrofolate cyclo-ligase|tara:strand:- start:379 stop:909 length:531 start_codon:yes stop_codon:yes gene_type:complete
VNKSQIRIKISKIRKKNNFKDLSINFNTLNKILNKINIKDKCIGGYFPYNYEVDALKILNKLEKNYIIGLPKIKKNFDMDFFQWSSKDPLTINKYGIPEPTSKKIIYPSILLIPLLAFDKYLNRIGYGGGYYDRYIKKIKTKKNILTIGLAYSFQKVKVIPVNKYDKKLDYIITEK